MFGCGQCHLCKINHRRIWTTRLVLESSGHKDRAWVTLTYNNEHLPKGGNLVPDDFKNYIKRLRKKAPKKIRYFGCGEYGKRFKRPHYHILLFGISEKEVDIISKAWSIRGKSLGNVFIGDVNQDTIQYTAGYCLKKSFTKNQYTKQGGKISYHEGDRVREFTRMSLKPAIGLQKIKSIARSIERKGQYTLEMQLGGDVPSTIRMNGKLWPIGRYLRENLRVELGVDLEEVKKINLQILKEEFQEKVKEIEEKEEYKKEVIELKQQLRSGQTNRTEYLRSLMFLDVQAKVERSEKLAVIYKQKQERIIE